MSDIHLAPGTTMHPFLITRNELASLIDDIQKAHGKPTKVTPERLMNVLSSTLRHMTDACLVINQGQLEGVAITIPFTGRVTAPAAPSVKRQRGLSERRV